MGLADRNYMRGGPSGTGVPATHAVLGVLVGFFILGLVAESSGTSFLRWMALPGARADAWQFLTYAFLHDGFWHLLGNGLLLWWVGPLVEAEQGRAGLVRVLMLGALVGALFVGIVEAFGAFWASAFKEVIVFTLILPILLVRSLRSGHSDEEH